MKLLPLFMIALASYPLHAQDIIVYTHKENPYNSTTKTFNEKADAPHLKTNENKNDLIPFHSTPVGNFLNISHKLPKNSTYRVFDNNDVQFLFGRLTVNGVIPVKSLSKGTYKLHLNDKPVLWFIKK